MKRLLPILVSSLLLAVLCGPMFIFAQAQGEGIDPAGPIIPCGKSGDNCTYDELFKGANNLINFVILYLVVPLSVIAILRAGIMLVLNGSNPTAHKAAKDSFVNILIGMFFIFGAFVIVKSILLLALNDKTSIAQYLRSRFR